VFEGIVGQENAKKTLGLMTESGRIPHTLLFTGPYGVGKSETALELARMLLCEHGVGSGCDACGSCIRASRIEHPDLHLLFPYRDKPKKAEGYNSWVDGLLKHRKLLAEERYAPVTYEKGRQIVIELVREAHEKLLESSFEGGRRVCVVILAERLNDKTANSLLKILEEPPDGVHFVLTAERLSSVLPTIVSRSSIVRFRRMRIAEIERFLEHNGVEDPGERRAFARASEGSLKSAKAFAFSDITDVYSRAFDIYAHIAMGGYGDVVDSVYPDLQSRDILETEELITGFVHCTRSVLETKMGMKTETDEHSETIRALSGHTDVSSLHRLSAVLERSLDMLGRNVNISMVLATLYYEIHDTFRKEQVRQYHSV